MERTVESVFKKVDAILKEKPHFSAACALWCALNNTKPGDECSGDCRKCMFDSVVSVDKISNQEQKKQPAQEPKQEQKEEKNIRREVLQAAINTVCQDREMQYGDPEDNFANIAKFWNVFLNAKHGLADDGSAFQYVDSDDVAAMMSLLKLARVATGAPKLDNWIDLAGYAACGAELQNKYTRGDDNA